MSKVTKVETSVGKNGEIEIYITKVYSVNELEKALDFVDNPNNHGLTPFWYKTNIPKLRGDEITCSDNECWNDIIEMAKTL